jgi:ADP-heptose:LPS heptosyltransferase
MSRRRRWRNVKGSGSRVTSPKDRLMVSLVSAGARLVGPFLPRPGKDAPREILILRLDRIGDVLMSLPALAALRDARPEVRIRLAVGEWSREIAEDASVDEVLVWSAPWVGRSDEGASSPAHLFNSARALRSSRPDLAIDLQGDLRAMWLMAATGARARVGYANTGSARLLTRVVELDENIGLVEQNYRALETALGQKLIRKPFQWLDQERRGQGRRFLRAALEGAGLEVRGPLVGLHVGAGRRIKEWPLERFAALGRRLVEDMAATLILTGSPSEAPRAAALRSLVPDSVLDLSGQLSLRGLAETMSACDAFVSGDTAAMHFACALGLPSVAIFGPSDPGRYFSGGELGFGSGPHVALSPELWCSPCNQIRTPPRECDAAPSPECLLAISPEEVFEAIRSVLSGRS